MFLVEHFLWSQNHSFENRFVPNIFIKNVLDENFLGSQNHFLEKGFLPKIFIINCLYENFYGRKIISWKTCSYQKFSSKIFCSKILYGLKIISSKTVSYQNIFIENFLLSQNKDGVRVLCIIITKQRIQFVSFLSLPCRILCFCTLARGTLHTGNHIVYTHSLVRFMKIFRCAYLIMEAVHRHPRHQMS